MSHPACRVAQEDVSRQAALWYWKLQSPQLPASEWEAYRVWHAVPEHRHAFMSVAAQWEQISAPDGMPSDCVEPLWRALVCLPDADPYTPRGRTMPSLQELFDATDRDDTPLTATPGSCSPSPRDESSPDASGLQRTENSPDGTPRIHIINEEAAYWYVVCTDDDQSMLRSDQREFVAWMRRSPDNIVELLRVARLDGKHRRLKLVLGALGLWSSAPPELYRDLVERYDETGEAKPLIKPLPRARPLRTLAVSLAFALLTSLLMIVSLAILYDGVISTGPAEQRQLVLEDGSRVFLQTSSRVKLEFSETARVVLIDSGEVYFSVAGNDARPFVARTSIADVMTTDARFVVSINSGVRTRVSAGVVRLTLRAAHTTSVVLRAGEEFVISEATPSRPLAGTPRRLPTTIGGLNFHDALTAQAAHPRGLRNAVQPPGPEGDISPRTLMGYHAVPANSPDAFAHVLDATDTVNRAPIEPETPYRFKPTYIARNDWAS